MSNKYVHREKDAAKFNKYGIDLTVYDDINNVVLVSVKEGHFEEFKHSKSTFIYSIIKGEGTFYLNGEPHVARAGDLVVIPPNTQIYYFGTMEMVLTCTPTWTEEDETHIRYVDKTESPYLK